MQGTWVDVQNAWRSLVRNPRVFGLAVLMLALGLGFNIALLSVVDATVLRPLPYQGSDRLMFVWTGRFETGGPSVNSYADFIDWRARARTLSAMAIYNVSTAVLVTDGLPEEIRGATVSPEFFDVMRAPLALGRGLNAADALETTDRPVVISHSLWRQRFSSDPSIIGRLITLAERSRRVVGVMGPTFEHPDPFSVRSTEYWSPLIVTNAMRQYRAMRFLRVIGRLHDSATPAQARAELDTIGRNLMQEHPTTNPRSVILVPVREQLLRDTGPVFLLFLGAVALVLSLACANIVNILLARLGQRRLELAVRAALGAGRPRLIRQLLVEGAFVGAVAGVVGLAAGLPLARLLARLAPIRIMGLDNVGLSPRLLMGSLALSVFTGVLCSLAPAVKTARAHLLGRTGDPRTAGADLLARRGRRWLVAAEMALAVPLLVGAGLLVQSLIHVQRIDLGFQPAGVLSFHLSLNGERYASTQAQRTLYSQLIDHITAVPGVTSAGLSLAVPFVGINETGGQVTIMGDGSAAAKDMFTAYRVASPGYFPAMGITLVRGRLFERDEREAVVVNERFASDAWGDANPIGQRIHAGYSNTAPPSLTVVGVVRSVRHQSFTSEPDPEMFVAFDQNVQSSMFVAVRSGNDPMEVLPIVREVIQRLDPRLPLVDPSPMQGIVDEGLARHRFGMACAAAFGILGLTLAATGVFAVISLIVGERTREIGVRMALGAAPRDVRILLLRQSMTPALTGTAVGIAATLAVAHWLNSLVFGVTTTDVATLSAATLVLCAVALAASWWPARRAMQLDPVVALKDE